MLNNVNFSPGDIVYDEFHIDFNKKLEEQLLTEDLLQVVYPKSYLIDLGWYPEGNLNGNFILNIIYCHNWEYPILKKVVPYNLELITKALLESTNLIKELIN